MAKNNFVIKDGRPKDAAGIVEVNRQTWLDTYPNRKLGITTKGIEKFFSNKDERIKKWQKSLTGKKLKSHVWVAKYGTKIVGFCRVAKKPRVGEISSIYILPKYQSKGIGNRLMRKALNWFGPKLKVELSVAANNKNAINFYNKFGFKAEKQISYKFFNKKLPSVNMLKQGVK